MYILITAVWLHRRQLTAKTRKLPKRNKDENVVVHKNKNAKRNMLNTTKKGKRRKRKKNKRKEKEENENK